MRRRRNHDNYPVGDGLFKTGLRPKVHIAGRYRKSVSFTVCFLFAKRQSLSRYLLAYIISHLFVKNNIFPKNLILERLNPQTYKIRHFCLVGASKGGFIVWHLGYHFAPLSWIFFNEAFALRIWSIGLRRYNAASCNKLLTPWSAAHTNPLHEPKARFIGRSPA